jgi:hypothetical protein
MPTEILSLPPFIQTVINLAATYSEFISFILGLLSFPLVSGLLSRLPPKELMRRVERRTDAEDNYLEWLQEVEDLADQLEHQINAEGLTADGKISEETDEKFEELIALRSGPDQPVDEFADAIEEIQARITDVRNARTDTNNAPSEGDAQQELEDLLEKTREQAAVKRSEFERSGILKVGWR